MVFNAHYNITWQKATDSIFTSEKTEAQEDQARLVSQLKSWAKMWTLVCLASESIFFSFP